MQLWVNMLKKKREKKSFKFTSATMITFVHNISWFLQI